MNDTLDETNYQSFAKKAIEKYNDNGQLVDAMVWSKIIGYYEADLLKKTSKLGQCRLWIQGHMHLAGITASRKAEELL